MQSEIRQQIHQAVNAFTSVTLESIPHFIREDFEKIRQLMFIEMNHSKNKKAYYTSLDMLQDAVDHELPEVLKEIPGALKQLQVKTLNACEKLPPDGLA